jgi:hypothetical protein
MPDNVSVQTRAGVNRTGFFFTPATATSQAQFTFSIEVSSSAKQPTLAATAQHCGCA